MSYRSETHGPGKDDSVVSQEGPTHSDSGRVTSVRSLESLPARLRPTVLPCTPTPGVTRRVSTMWCTTCMRGASFRTSGTTVDCKTAVTEARQCGTVP